MCFPTMPDGEPAHVKILAAPGAFEFATATRIIFGAGSVGKLSTIVGQTGRRALILTGGATGRVQPHVDAVKASSDAPLTGSIANEPTVDQVDTWAEAARMAGVDIVVSIGGGSVIDAGKAIAALCTNPGGALEYLEVVGRGKPLQHPPLPFVAVPTTAGTGAEVTRNAVLGVTSAGVKASLRSPLMLPDVALVDPELTYSAPAAVTASTGMDALTQVVEPFLSCRANAMTDAFCRDGIPRIARSLRRACEAPEDAEARANMSYGSLLGGLALANSGLGAVHGFAAPIGGAFPAPHGAVCAALLPPVLEANLQAIRRDQHSREKLDRFTELARMLTGDPDAAPDDAISWCASLAKDLGIPKLSQWGIRSDDFAEIVARAKNASSMRANPVALSDQELSEILNNALT